MTLPPQGAALLVEDDPFMQGAVSDFLIEMGFAVQPVSTFQAASQLLQAQSPADAYRIAIVDLSIPRHSDLDHAPREPLGLHLVRQIKSQTPATGVVVWSAYTHFLPQVIELVTRGQRGLAFVPKGSRAATLRQAIERVLVGDVYFHGSAIATIANEAERAFLAAMPADIVEIVQEAAQRYELLSPRQQQVMERFAYRPEVIAADLGVDLHTVRNYQDGLYERLGLKDALSGAQQMRREAVIVLAVLLRRLREPAREARSRL